MKLTYSQVGDYLLPNLILSENPNNVKPLGKYGMMHKDEHRLVTVPNHSQTR